mmetsp:Transcript_38240/g.71224  ORF Transcript_38240/g.71224 Transcript_38240/m.71224 type:complete len:200 (-) Transcript_38240:919-1518(-)
MAERFGQNPTRRRHVSAEPLLFGGHEPQDLSMRAVRDGALQDVVKRLGVAVLRLKLRESQPQALLSLQVHHCVVVDGTSNLDGVSVDGRICILDPVLLHALDILIHSNLDGHLDDRLTRLDEARLLGFFGLLQPHVSVRRHAVGCQRVDGAGQDELHHLLIALGLLQLRSCHPNHRAGRDVLPRLVQHLLGVLVSRKLR